MDNPRLPVFFMNDTSKVVDIQKLSSPSLAPYLAGQDRFNPVEVPPDVFVVYWNDQEMPPNRELFTHGVIIPLTLDALHQYVQHRIVSASEACSVLYCSRQNIDDLNCRDKLYPIRTDAKYNRFAKAEVMKRRKECSS